MLLKSEQNQTIKDLLEVIISEVVVYFNAGKNMSPHQIVSTVDLILNDNIALNLTFEDYKVCFEFAKKGAYGKIYDRLDGQIIFDWLNQYSFDRTNEFLKIRDQKEKEELNKKLDVSEINPEGQKKVLEILSQYSKKIEPQIKASIEKTERQKLIQRFFSQFTKIVTYGKNRSLDDSYRFIFMYGKILSSPEYVEIKLIQHERVFKSGRTLNILKP